jgi:ABC-type glycerol-3-phosphate transport system permease component
MPRRSRLCATLAGTCGRVGVHDSLLSRTRKLDPNRTKTLPVAVYNFISYAQIDWGGLMAAAVVITVPVLVLALVTQRFIVRGLTAGAVKG